MCETGNRDLRWIGRGAAHFEGSVDTVEGTPVQSGAGEFYDGAVRILETVAGANR
jgi:hypothetical protein